MNASADEDGAGDARTAPGEVTTVSLFGSSLALAATFNYGMWILFMMLMAMGNRANKSAWLAFVLPPIAAAAVTISRAAKVPAGTRFRHGCLASLIGWPLGVLGFLVVDSALIESHLIRSIGKESMVAVIIGVVGLVASPAFGIVAGIAGRVRDSRRLHTDARGSRQ